MSLSLYEIGNAYTKALNQEYNNADTLLNALDLIDESFDQKVENIIKYMRSIEIERDILAKEADRLLDKADVLNNKYESLKQYIFDCMKKADRQEVKTPLFKASIQKNPPKVNIFNDSNIPEEYLVIKKEISKFKIKYALIKGLEVEGCTLIQDESLRIK